MAVLRSLVFAILFYGATVLAVLLAFPVMLFGRGALHRLVLTWVGFYGWAARAILGIRLAVEGRVPEGEAVLVAAKHEAMFETLVLVTILRDPMPVLKRELARIPLFGFALRRWGVIPVDRAGSAKALRGMIGAAAAARESGRPILIFPEGTRVPHGDRPPLRAGFAGLYRAVGLPVVPVALDSGRLWPKGLVKHPGTITLRFEDPVPPGLPRREAEALVHAAINRLNG